jgi:hypothetical protein
VRPNTRPAIVASVKIAAPRRNGPTAEVDRRELEPRISANTTREAAASAYGRGTTPIDPKTRRGS